MNLVPITLDTANKFVLAHHRHNRPVVGHRFSIGLETNGTLIGVAIIGRPVARELDDGLTAEVTRVCVKDAAGKGACSKLYSAARRAWRAMGGKRLVTYTLGSEGGYSLRGAGWKAVATVEPRDNPWCGPDRQRTLQGVFTEPKLRWEAP